MSLGKLLLKKLWDATGKKDAIRIAAQTPTPGVTKLSDIPYLDDDNNAHRLNVYYPEGTTSSLPTIVDVHGGGWLYGDRHLNDNYCRYLAKKGFAVVALDYRLIDEERFPAQLHDIFAALNFLVKNADNYYCDLNHAFLTGDSAGGHLSAMTLAVMGNEAAQKKFGLSTDIKFLAAALTCGFYDFSKLVKLNISVVRAYGEYFLGKGFRKSPSLPDINVKTFLTENCVPLYLSSGEGDFIRSQSNAFVKLLDEKKIPYTYKYWQKQVEDRKLDHVFNITHPEWKESMETNDAVCDFFRSFIK